MKLHHVYQRQIEWVGIVAFCAAVWSAIGAGIYVVVVR